MPINATPHYLKAEEEYLQAQTTEQKIICLKKMLALAQESAENFSRRFLGKTMTVLWEKQTGGVWSGHTDNYIKVYTKNTEDLTNKLLPVKLVEVRGDGVWGEC